MAVRTRPPPGRPRARRQREANQRTPTPSVRSRCPAASLPRAGTRPGGAAPTSFLVPAGVRRGNPRLPRARGRLRGSGACVLRALPALGAGEAEREKTRPLVSPPRGRAPEGRGAVGAPGGGQHPRSPEFVFTFGRTTERTPGGVVLPAAGSRLAAGGAARSGLLGGGAGRRADYKSLQRGRRRRREPAGASRAPRPRAGPRCPRADTRLPTRAVPPSRRPARAAAQCAAAPRRVRAWSCQGHGRGGPALCVSPNRGRTCRPPPPRPSGVSMEVALTAQAENRANWRGPLEPARCGTTQAGPKPSVDRRLRLGIRGTAPARRPDDAFAADSVHPALGAARPGAK